MIQLGMNGDKQRFELDLLILRSLRQKSSMALVV